jgi:BASS family bile acid:Na+ symporter
MFFSIKPLFKHQLHIKKKLKQALFSVGLNYVFLSGFVLVMSFLLFEPGDLLTGFIILAILPPAVSIMPLNFLLKGDSETAIIALFISYLIALVVLPLTFLFVFKQVFDIILLLRVILVIMVLPFMAAYLTRKMTHKVFSYGKALINLFLGGIIIFAVSVNRESILSFTPDLGNVYLLSASIPVFGLLVYYLAKDKDKPAAINYSLYTVVKNRGLGLALALFFFSNQVAIPSIIGLITEVVYFIIFKKFIVKV